MRTAIWWLRRDLRLLDNQALTAALHAAEQVVPVFIFDPALLGSPYLSEKRLAFLYACLEDLDLNLRGLGSYLVLREGKPAEVLKALVHELGAEMVFAEQDISPYATRRDTRVSQAVPIRWVGFPSVHPPGSVVKADGSPYTVYTPFSKRWKALPLPDKVVDGQPGIIKTPPGILVSGFPAQPTRHNPRLFPAGEAEALNRLDAFCRGEDAPIYHYRAQRDAMGTAGTSGLSPYLRFGLLSARRAAAAAAAAMKNAPSQPAFHSAETWLNELIWREFYIHILYFFPHARLGSFRPALRSIRWENDSAMFAAWCRGQTGYPVVDAAMRQLEQTGWMHNRARMIVASFLTKDLHIDWRWGEKWFMQHLLDGDPAANNGGWQWTAGTGTDAAPYFRIFNPVSQSKKFDPYGEYIRQWVPELAAVPTQYIHEPWQMPAPLQVQLKCVIGREYPERIVDHQFARQKTLDLYGAAKNDP